MSSRRTLVSILACLMLPFVLEATTGCGNLFGLEKIDDPADNSLRCNCHCDETNSRIVKITASSDDAEQSASGTTVNLTSSALELGGTNLVGLRFADVKIPPDADVLDAYVQFTADAAGETGDTDLKIRMEANVAAPTFTTTPNDLNGRGTGANEIQWFDIPAWNTGQAGTDQRTPNLEPLIQEIIDAGGWKNSSAIVLRITPVSGTGRRTAESVDGDGIDAPVLVLTYSAKIAAELPVCAPGAATGSDGAITAQGLIDECNRVNATFTELAGQCGYPTTCSCEPVPAADGDHDASTYTANCDAACDPVALITSPPVSFCSNFDPSEFTECFEQTQSVETCKHYVAATNGPSSLPVCVDSGSPLAFHMFGRRTRCEVSGTADIVAGDEAPINDPTAGGTIELLGGPCVGGGCAVYPYFALNMSKVEFDVFGPNPVFGDLSASGRGVDAAVLDGVAATFVPNDVAGTGNGQRGSDSAGFVGGNSENLVVGVDWAGKECDMVGNIAGSLGFCEDGTTICTTDSPDCDGIGGGTCAVPAEDAEEMSVNVHLVNGTLVNQPPVANAGPDQEVECTSANGAEFLLDGRGSHDPDENLALASWRAGGRFGTEISDDLIATNALGLGDTQTYVLQVIDSYSQTDVDDVEATVVDTTPPVISCNIPATIRPPTTPLTFTATATDVCDASVTPDTSGFECYKFDKKLRRVDVVCRASASGNSITILNSIGVGTHINWHLGASDDSTNSSEPTTCHTLVVNPVK